MAPEMIQNKNHDHTLDIWSLGILLYELVHGRAPFTGAHPREISDKIMRGQIRYKPGLSNEYKDLVNKILVYETNERLPLIKVFDHPWVKNFEKKYNLSKQPPPKPPKMQAQPPVKQEKQPVRPKKEKEMKPPIEPVIQPAAPKQEVMRQSNKSQKDDIMKELEDYVKEKNHKYLDDLSDIDAENTTPGQKELNKSQ